MQLQTEVDNEMFQSKFCKIKKVQDACSQPLLLMRPNTCIYSYTNLQEKTIVQCFLRAHQSFYIPVWFTVVCLTCLFTPLEGFCVYVSLLALRRFLTDTLF